MRILAVDYGDARTGIAVSDEMELLASPVTVIHQKNSEKLAEEVAELTAKHRAKLIVLGFPKHMNGSIGERGEKTKLFAASLKEKVEVPIVLWDERGTTITAHGYLNITNTRGKKRKNVVDAVAATIILENYLSWRKNNPDRKDAYEVF